MESPWPILVLIAIGVIALIVWGIMSAAKRRKELAEWAGRHGLRFRADSDYGLDSRYASFQCLQQGSRRYAYNLVDGAWQGRPFLGFDYHYETYATDSKGQQQTHHHYFSAVILDSDVPLKPLNIRPEGVFDKIAQFFGWDDINFESAEFSSKFHVTAPDRRWAYDVLHARTIAFLLQMPRFSLQFDDRRVIAYKGSTFSVAEFESAAEIIRGILDRLPDYVIQQQRQPQA